MLTPRFVLNQTENEIIVTVHAPYANIAETEVYVQENDVRFHSSPYYLRLNLPGCVEENDGSRAIYDADSRDFIIRLGKTVPGEYFPDLDMITKLLAPKASSSKAVPDISIIGVIPDDDVENDLEDDEMQWFVEQVPMAEDDDLKFGSGICYGFANSHHSVFKKIKSEIPQLVDLPEPDITPQRDREALRVEDELSYFNEGHYLADLEDSCDKNSVICSVISYKGPWKTEPDEFASLSEANLDVLKDLPNKEYLMDDKEKISCYLGIIDLLFAYAYDQRTTVGEGNVESGWTIAKLSPMLSWLQTFSSLDALVKSCIRRSLCFPLYRHWDLSLNVLDDTRQILHLGKASILKCLLHIYSVFNANDPQYVLNQLYIRDYCIWIQKASAKKIKSLAEALDKCNPKMEDLDVGLIELEAVMAKTKQKKNKEREQSLRDTSVDIFEQNFSKLSIGKKSDERDSDDTSTCDSSPSSESSTSSDGTDSSDSKECIMKNSDS